MNSIPQPTIRTLVVSCISSMILAATVFVIAVLPAEFNIDPTGLGKILGLTVLAPKVDDTAKPSVIVCPQKNSSKLIEKQKIALQWQDSVMISVPPHKGLEYKFYIRQGEKFDFLWEVEGIKLYFDFHGEPEGDTSGYFKSYKESTESESSGTLMAPFTGSHGWYWKNKTNQTAVISLKTRGNYKVKGLM